MKCLLIVLLVILSVFMGCDKTKKMSLKEKVNEKNLICLTENQKKLIDIVIADYSGDTVLSDRKVVYDVGNTLWQEKTASLQLTNKDIANNLDYALCGHKYQAIKLELLPDRLGGDIWYFIDTENDEIITVYGEK